MGLIELFAHLNSVKTNDIRYIELLEIEVFERLTVCKQTKVKIELFVINNNTLNDLTVCK